MNYRLQAAAVDAWRDEEGGWVHNNVFFAGYIDVPALTPRAIFNALREEGLLTDASKGRVALDEPPTEPPIFDVLNKGTREPLFTLEEVAN